MAVSGANDNWKDKSLQVISTEDQKQGMERDSWPHITSRLFLHCQIQCLQITSDIALFVVTNMVEQRTHNSGGFTTVFSSPALRGDGETTAS